MSYTPEGTTPKKNPILKYCLIGCVGTVILVMLIMGGAGALVMKGYNKANPAAEAALTNLQNGELRTIYDELDPDFQQTLEFDELRDSFTHVREVMGPLRSWSKTGTNLNTDESGTFATFEYSAVFVNGDGNIRVVLKAQDGDPPYRVTELRVFSPLLE